MVLRAPVLSGVSTLLVCAVCMLCSGTCYGFSSFSNVMKEQLELTQQQVELVGLLSNVGGNLGAISGVMVAVLPEWQVAATAALCCLLGYGSAGELVRSGSANMPLLSSAFILVGFGSTLMYSLCLSVSLGHFAASRRGRVIALLVAVYGLSASIFTATFNFVFAAQDVAAFLDTTAVALAIVFVLAAVTIRRRRTPLQLSPGVAVSEALPEIFAADVALEQHKRTDEVAMAAAAESAATAAATVAVAEQERSDDDGEWQQLLEHRGNGAHIHTPQRTYLTTQRDPEHSAAERSTSPSCPARAHKSAHLDGRSNGDSTSSNGSGSTSLREVVVILSVLLRSVTFYLLAACMFLIAGGGYVLLNNLGSMIAALNDGRSDPQLTLQLITLLSLCNAAGRFAAGSSDLLTLRRGAFLLLAATLMASGYAWAWLAVTRAADLTTTVALCGVGYGVLWATAPTVTAEAFGARRFAVVFGWLGLSPAASSTTFNLIAGMLYQNRIIADATAAATAATAAAGDTAKSTAPAERNCIGVECFRSTMLLCAVAAVCGFGIALVLLPRTRIGNARGGMRSMHTRPDEQPVPT